MSPEIKDSIGFSGTRHGMSDFQKQSLEDMLIRFIGKFSWFHHGSCVGADYEAHKIAKKLGYKIAVHPPTDKTRAVLLYSEADYEYDPADYLERNRGIVNQSTFLIAAPETMQEKIRSGTWMTIRYAKSIDKYTKILARKQP